MEELLVASDAVDAVQLRASCEHFIRNSPTCLAARFATISLSESDGGDEQLHRFSNSSADKGSGSLFVTGSLLVTESKGETPSMSGGEANEMISWDEASPMTSRGNIRRGEAKETRQSSFRRPYSFKD